MTEAESPSCSGDVPRQGSDLHVFLPPWLGFLFHVVSLSTNVLSLMKSSLSFCCWCLWGI